ncbi:MAG: PAS domain S-box protein [Betaproteobacteria bacterium]
MPHPAEPEAQPAARAAGWRALNLPARLSRIDLHCLGRAALLAAIYFAVAKLSLLLAIPPGYATAVWPPAGIALAAVLIHGSSMWPGILLGAALVNFTVNSSVLAAAVIGAGNTLEALLAAAIIRHYIGVPWRFERGEDVATFLAAAILGGALAATVSLAPLAYLHALPVAELFWNWLTWWLGDAVGIVLITPLILSWRARSEFAWTPERIVEAACLAVLIAAAAYTVFGATARPQDSYALKFLIVPLAIWTAFRFSQREVTTVAFGVCLYSVWEAFATTTAAGINSNQALLTLVTFNSTVALTGLVLSAVLYERSTNTAALKESRDELETRVRERTVELQRANRALQLDIASRMRTEKLLLESEERFRQMVASVVDYAIFMLDVDGRVASWNAGAARIKRYTSEEIIGRHFSCFYPSADVDSGKPWRHLEVASLEGRVEDEGWRIRKDGSIYWASVVLTAVRDAGGKLIGFSEVTRDLTDRIRAEEELRRGEARFGVLVNSVVDYGIIMLDPEGRVSSWNTGAERILGYSADEMLGRHFSVFYYREDIERGKPQQELELASSEGRHEDEGWRIRKDGSRFWANVVVAAIHDSTGKLLGFSKIMRDLSERKRLELELTDARTAAEQSSRMKSDFLAKMSHELRTPLNSLLILARLLADNAAGNLSPKQVQYAQTIHAAGTDLLELINDLLDLAKIESGTVKLSIEAERFSDLCDYTRHTFEQTAQAKGLEFEITLDEHLPPSFMTDGRRLHQILRNLLANAFKFTHQGRVGLDISLATSGWASSHPGLNAAAEVVAFSVSDTGIGIPHDKKETVFEAFQQLDQGTSRQYGGAGLGLPICRELTRLLGGELKVSSEPGRGSTFVLYLPLTSRDRRPLRAPGEGEPARETASQA